MARYKIIDLQIPGHEFADGAVFKNKEEVRRQLVDFHSNDCDGKSLEKMSLDSLLEFGEWELVTL